MRGRKRGVPCEGVCVSLQHLSRTVERSEVALPLEELFGRVQTGLCGRDGLEPLAKVRKRTILYR